MLQKIIKTVIWAGILSISIGYTLHLILDKDEEENPTSRIVEEEIYEDEEELGHLVTATYYNPVAEQCWGDPLVTASRKRIDLEKLENEEIKWIAVSRDLLAHYKYGDKVEISCPDDPSINGIYSVEDIMHERFSNMIDLLWHPSKKGRGKWKNVVIKKIEEP